MAAQRCDFQSNPQAEKLVEDYLEAVLRACPPWQQRYPHEDIEYIFVGALYRAAWTWEPGKASFWHWWNRKARGSLSGIRRRIRRGTAGPMMGTGAGEMLAGCAASECDPDAKLDAPELLAKLPDRESRCLREWTEGMSMREIGECEGCCKQRISQLIGQAKERLRD